MTRDELIDYIQSNYDTNAEYPWQEYPNYAVFRHQNNAKWFALIMGVPSKKLNDTGGDEIIDIVDLKVAPELMGTLRLRCGIHPAYHMNKEHWVSIELDSNFRFGELKLLISDSYRLTDTKI